MKNFLAANLTVLCVGCLVATAPAKAGEWNKIASKIIAACSDGAPEQYEESLTSAGFTGLSENELQRVGQQFTYAQRLATYARSQRPPDPASHDKELKLFTGVVSEMSKDTDVEGGPRIYTYPGDTSFFVMVSEKLPSSCGFTHIASPQEGALRIGEFDEASGVRNPDAITDSEHLTSLVRVPNGREKPFILFKQFRPKEGSETSFGGDAIVSEWNIRP